MIPYRNLYLRGTDKLFPFDELLFYEERKVRQLAAALQKWEYPRRGLISVRPVASRSETHFLLLVAGVIAASFAYFLHYPALGFCLLVFLAIFYFSKVRDHCIALVDFQLLLADKIKEIERNHDQLEIRLMFTEAMLKIDSSVAHDESWREHREHWCDVTWDDSTGNFRPRQG